MSIKPIDNDLCTGCGICVETCPMDVIRMDESGYKAVVRYVGDCMLCYACELDCPEGAIYISPEKGAKHVLSWG
ncbi:MAG: ferredoxin family protein [Deltaproteobacteria bacterium]|nr:ferredoxin family protein [Deltaproteobacteria bacterium]